MYGTKSEILLEKILKNVGVFNTSPYFYAIESNPYSTKTERLLYLIEVHTRVLARLIPPGGNQGDLLAKASNADFDLEWIENYTSSVKHTVKLGEPINKGQAVYVSSAAGTNMVVSKASNASEATSSKTMGLLAFTGVTNDQGFVVTEGLLAGLDTSSANASDPVWLGTDGNLIFGLVNKPVAPAHLVFIGIVTRSQQNNGEIFVKVQNGFELKEIHDVLLTSPTNGNMLVYDEVNSLWKNSNIIQRTSTDAALRVTQLGTGEAIRVEDETNPDATPFLVTADGRVGIGLSSLTGTTHKLHVRLGLATNSTPAANTVALFENSTHTYVSILSPDAQNAGIVYGSNSNRFGAFNAWNFANNTMLYGTAVVGAKVQFQTDNQQTRMTILSNGNVGIGDTNPSQTLTVNGIAVASTSFIAPTIQATTLYPQNDVNLNIRTRDGGAGDKDIVFGTGNPSGTPFTRMTVKSTGNVGIGTTTPNSLFHVFAGSSGITPISGTTMTIENSTTNYLSMLAPNANLSGIVMGSLSDSFGAFIRWGHTSGKLEIGTANSNDYIELYVENSVSKAFITTNGLGINAQPVASAALQADSTTQGFLPPRMTNAQRVAIVNPAVGLMVYCTDAVEGLYINKSTGWTFVI